LANGATRVAQCSHTNAAFSMVRLMACSRSRSEFDVQAQGSVGSHRAEDAARLSGWTGE